MSKRPKILVSVTLAILLLIIGIAVPALAQDGSASARPDRNNGLLSRVAEILNVSQEDLIVAFEQARQEQRENIFIRAIDKAREIGIINEDDANAIQEWWQQRPEALKRVPLLPPFRINANNSSNSGIRPWSGTIITRVAEILDIPREDLVNALDEARQEMSNGNSSQALNNAEAKGRITREQVNKNRERLEQKQGGIQRQLLNSSGMLRREQAGGSSGASLQSGTFYPAP